MPATWTRFTTRFSALAQTYNNSISINFEQIPVSSIKKNTTALSLILLDENNCLQLPRLIDFITKHNQTVHKEVLAVTKQVLIMREEQRILNGSLLCPQILEFGECDETHCDNRHELTRFDIISKNDDIPYSGEIRIHVLKVFTPTYYAVRLLQHKLPNTDQWFEVRRSSEAVAFGIQLNMHYGNENNLLLHWPPHVNDLCIYQYLKSFRRARILEAPVFQQKNTNVVQSKLKVTLGLIDDGIIINSIKCNEIFVCDDKFKDFPYQSVDVRLMNIVPFDNERTWESRTTKQVQKWLMTDIKSNYVIQASIDFSLAKTIWIKNLVVMEKLADINAYCQVVHLKKSLISKSFGVLYQGDRKHIRELAKEYGLLNTNDINDDIIKSKLDYKSVEVDSTDLIIFSSSNDEVSNSSIEFPKTDLELEKQSEKHKSFDDQDTTKAINVKMSSKNEQNWDDDNDVHLHNEV